MKNYRVCAVLYYVCAVVYFLVGAIEIFRDHDTSKGIVWLCLGSTFLCLGSSYLNKMNQENDDEDDDTGTKES
ncbi:MAG: hypothetical protein IKC03_11160 [Oscillospiraceae bacterium]|nr:hypothetical protein [Oscillospiraceae bacterium]